jgi:hypothetical protein
VHISLKDYRAQDSQFSSDEKKESGSVAKSFHAQTKVLSWCLRDVHWSKDSVIRGGEKKEAGG